MTSSVYYPRTVCTPQDIADKFCPQGLSSEEFRQRFLSANSSMSPQSLCAPSRPVMVPSVDQGNPVGLGPLLACRAEERNTLAQLSHYAGGTAVMGLANFLSETRIPAIAGDLNTFGANGMGAAVAQSDKVLAAIDYYDYANNHYEQLKNHRAAPTTILAAKRAAERAFVKMNGVLHARSLSYLNNNAFRMRQTTTVTGREAWESIPVRESADVQRLSKFAKVGRILGPGLILLDGGMRSYNVHHAWRNGDPNWKRMAFVEGGSFTLGVGAGVAIGLAIAFTPVGLVVGIVAGGAVAVGADHLFKRLFNLIYDEIRG